MIVSATLSTSFVKLLSQRRTIRAFDDSKMIPAEMVKSLVWAAQGSTGEEGRRTSPSAHALNPLRLFVVAANVEGLETGLHAVHRDTNELECVERRDLRPELQYAALDEQPWIGKAGCLLIICADFATPCRDFADQPPFGRRGSRYVYIEAGAASQNVQLRAVELGLACTLVAGFNDEATGRVLGLKMPLSPVLHLCIGWPAEA